MRIPWAWDAMLIVWLGISNRIVMSWKMWITVWIVWTTVWILWISLQCVWQGRKAESSERAVSPSASPPSYVTIWYRAVSRDSISSHFVLPWYIVPDKSLLLQNQASIREYSH